MSHPPGGAMKEVAEYRRYAEICRKLSLDSGDPVAKRHLMEMAAVWTMIAADREEQVARVSQTGRPEVTRN
jgi:hypothetical protein